MWDYQEDGLKKVILFGRWNQPVWDQLFGCSSSYFVFVAQNLLVERIPGCPGKAWECVAFFPAYSWAFFMVFHFWRDGDFDFPWSSWMWCSASPGAHQCLDSSVTTSFGAFFVGIWLPWYFLPALIFHLELSWAQGRVSIPTRALHSLGHPIPNGAQQSNIQRGHHIPGGENSKMPLENIWGNKISGACRGRGSQFCESRLQP